MIIVITYMTVEGENKAKYRVIGDVLEIFKNEKVLIMGDMNGHTGILGEAQNSNGKLLLEFAEEKELEILNHTIGQGSITWHDIRSDQMLGRG